jgi:hypothetical protein
MATFFELGKLMSRKTLGLVGAVIMACLIAVASAIFLTDKTPSETEVRQAVAAALPDAARIDELKFASFPNDRSSGRVSVKGIYNFGSDLYSLSTPPHKLLRALSAGQIFDRDVSAWWAANSRFYPQFKGKLGEYRQVYSKGESLEFAGELAYLAVVDSVRVESYGLEYRRIEGTSEPTFGYPDDADRVGELVKTITDWVNRQRDAEAAAAAAAAKAAVEKKVLEAAAKAAAEAARIAALVQATGDACGGVFENLKYCEGVVFDREGLKYEAYPERGHCSAADPGDAVDSVSLGGGQVRYTPKYLGVRVRFFELKVGETFGGFTCR